MLSNLKEQIQKQIEKIINDSYQEFDSLPSVELEIPSDKKHGDFSCNIALKSAKVFKKPPVKIANEIVEIIRSDFDKLPLGKKISNIEVKNPGFINFYLSPNAVFDVLDQVFSQGGDYGKSKFGNQEKVQIEFVSANPTGPLSVAHARQAAVGDVLGNILKVIGFDVTKEFYVNDEGNQINILGQSIELRAREILGETIDFPDECYQGEYLKDMAHIYIDNNEIKSVEDPKMMEKIDIMQFGVDYLLDVIKSDLKEFGVNFDVWSHQAKIAANKDIESILEYLSSKSLSYEKDGALWFSSTKFGDDKDRVLRKSDGAYTYLTPDIVYHKDKFDRGFSRVFNIWGPDHHGYIPRIKAAAVALGKQSQDLEVLIVQLATIYKNGEVISMSTRRGQYISLS